MRTFSVLDRRICVKVLQPVCLRNGSPTNVLFSIIGYKNFAKFKQNWSRWLRMTVLIWHGMTFLYQIGDSDMRLDFCASNSIYCITNRRERLVWHAWIQSELSINIIRLNNISRLLAKTESNDSVCVTVRLECGRRLVTSECLQIEKNL